MAKDNKTRILKVRCTEMDYAALVKMAHDSNLSVSGYVRHALSYSTALDSGFPEYISTISETDPYIEE